MKPKVYIDGKDGTTGLQIYERLSAREDITLLLIDEAKRKDPAERAKLMNQADLVFLCLPDAAARDGAVRQNVDMRMYRVIYDCIDEIEAAMKGMLAPKYREVVLGHAEVRQTYKVSSVGTVAGCYVQDGKIVRSCSVRVVRDGIVIHEGSLASLKRFKDDAREVAENYECGLTVEKFNDIKEGDIIEAFTMEEIPR